MGAEHGSSIHKSQQNDMTHQGIISKACHDCPSCPVSPPHRLSTSRHRGKQWGRRLGTGAYGSEGCIQRPVAETVLQEDIQLLLDKPRHCSPVGMGGPPAVNCPGLCACSQGQPRFLSLFPAGNPEHTPEVRCVPSLDPQKKPEVRNTVHKFSLKSETSTSLPPKIKG